MHYAKGLGWQDGGDFAAIRPPDPLFKIRRPKGRKIVVNNREWVYNIGKSYVVARTVDRSEKRIIDISKLTGVSWNEIERARWKKFYFAVEPHHIAEWLSKEE